MAALFCGCTQKNIPEKKNAPMENDIARVEETREAMGTFVSVTAIHEDREVAKAAVDAAFEEIKRVNSVMSNYDPDSELSGVNGSGTSPVMISDELYLVLWESKKYSDMTGGAFDVTVGPLMKEWNRARAAETAPDPQALAAARSRVGCRKMILDEKERTVRFETEGMEIDLGAIAKGYAADMAASIMRGKGVDNGLVNAGGDIVAFGHKQDGAKWTIGLRDPANAGATVTEIEVSGMAVTTSGNYEKFISSGGKKYSHIFDPRTGESSNCISASVIAPTAIEADALSTSICVMGPAQGMELVEKLKDAEAFLIDSEGNTYRSSGFNRYIVEGKE